MTGIHDLPLFVLAGLLLNLTPGPDMAYIAARASAGGYRAGLAAVAGITAGCTCHTLAAALGLSALVATSATAFSLIKWCGAAYLAYAGVRLLLQGARRMPDVAVPMRRLPGADAPVHVAADAQAEIRARARAIVREAFLINLLNPKVALFFLAFLPQFVRTDAPRHGLAFALLGCLFNADSLLVNVPVAWLASRAGASWRAGTRSLRVLHTGVGALFVVLGARLALAERS